MARPGMIAASAPKVRPKVGQAVWAQGGLTRLIGLLYRVLIGFFTGFAVQGGFRTVGVLSSLHS